MKKFVLNFTGFVNENFSEEFDTLTADDVAVEEVPEEVIKLATFIVNGNFEGNRSPKVVDNTIKISVSDQDFKYAPETLNLRDFGFETWSGKPFDVRLKLDDADENSKELTYSIEYAAKSARRAKVEVEDEFDVEDEYEKNRDEFGDVPETPDEDSGELVAKGTSLFKDETDLVDDDDEELMEGRKKQQGGFPKLKIKQAPKNSNPNFNPKNQPKKADLLKKDPKKMTDPIKDKNDDKFVPPVKK